MIVKSAYIKQSFPPCSCFEKYPTLVWGLNKWQYLLIPKDFVIMNREKHEKRQS